MRDNKERIVLLKAIDNHIKEHGLSKSNTLFAVLCLVAAWIQLGPPPFVA
jgi:hypothetical protein